MGRRLTRCATEARLTSLLQNYRGLHQRGQLEILVKFCLDQTTKH